MGNKGTGGYGRKEKECGGESKTAYTAVDVDIFEMHAQTPTTALNVFSIF